MCFLSSFSLGLVLAWLRVFFTEIVADELFCGAEGQSGKIGGVSTHVGNVSALIQALGYAHGLAYGHPQLACRLLLEGRCRERRGRKTVSFLLFNVADAEFRADAFLEKGFC